MELQNCHSWSRSFRYVTLLSRYVIRCHIMSRDGTSYPSWQESVRHVTVDKKWQDDSCRRCQNDTASWRNGKESECQHSLEADKEVEPRGMCEGEGFVRERMYKKENVVWSENVFGCYLCWDGGAFWPLFVWLTSRVHLTPVYSAHVNRPCICVDSYPHFYVYATVVGLFYIVPLL